MSRAPVVILLFCCAIYLFKILTSSVAIEVIIPMKENHMLVD